MTDVHELQARMVRWHALRFPHCGPDRVGLKLGEEAGEVQSAILFAVTDGDDGKGDVAEECADVLACLLVLADRFGFDLWAAADAKVSRLEARLAARVSA